MFRFTSTDLFLQNLLNKVGQCPALRSSKQYCADLAFVDLTPTKIYAAKCMERGLALNPAYPGATSSISLYLGALGRSEEAKTGSRSWALFTTANVEFASVPHPRARLTRLEIKVDTITGTRRRPGTTHRV